MLVPVLKMSTLFVRTLREDPADAEIASHKLLVRAGYIRRTAPGIYTWLPLGLKVLRKIEKIVREEMDRAGSQEVLFPALLPAEPYKQTNRYEDYGDNLFRLDDRRGNNYVLAPTHEEMFTLLVKDLYSSYKDLPLSLYQVQTKYRDEARPRAGLIRVREFVMKDAYSFDINHEGLEASYQAMRDAYQRVFDRVGLPYVIVSAMAGAMGGSRSEEFLFPTAVGEDTFVRSPGGYAANVEAVTTTRPAALDASGAPAVEVVPTPGAATIADVVAYLNDHHARSDRAWEKSDLLKTFAIMVAEGEEEQLVLLGVPGDREVDEKRVSASFGGRDIRMAEPEELTKRGIIPGYIGPNAHEDVPYYLDAHIAEGSVWVTGANERDAHAVGVVVGRDFEPAGYVEAAEVREGDPAPDGSGPLELARGMEIGHIFQLGTKYSEALGLTVLDQNGKSTIVTMGSYGIGVTRVLGATAEATCDEKGLCWPVHLAPAQVHVLATGKDDAVFAHAEKVAQELTDAGIEVLYDDRRKVSAGVKFADFELLGVPWGFVVGRNLAEGRIEIRNRRTGENLDVAVDDAVATMIRLIEEDMPATER